MEMWTRREPRRPDISYQRTLSYSNSLSHIAVDFDKWP
jgi:hypothetical protein